jgi:hypothetical protein
MEVDSGATAALNLSGSANVAAKRIDVVGGFSKSGSAVLAPTPVTGAPFISDPMAYLVPPPVGACDHTNYSVSNGSVTLNPGTYCNGITVSGQTTVTFNPGTYNLLGGGLKVSGSSTLTGTGVTFFLTQNSTYAYAPLAVSGFTRLNLKAPTSGAMEGVLFYQDPRIGSGKPASSLTGNSASTLEGVLYFPTTALTWEGSAAGYEASYTVFVADTIVMTGSATVNMNFSGLTHGSPLYH